MALNNVDLPTFGKPMIPHLKPMLIYQVLKFSISRLNILSL